MRTNHFREQEKLLGLIDGLSLILLPSHTFTLTDAPTGRDPRILAHAPAELPCDRTLLREGGRR
jgi:hypothetical protein